ncbi:MAG: thioredoxin fold domain-containing protein [Pseudomonadales bacterium]|nr:thioredoxin fold domain-containing protein [Pseudomonadales bacterium]
MKTLNILLSFALFWASSALALTPEEIQKKLEALKIPVEEVRGSQVPGMYEVVVNGSQSLFITEDGTHLLTGDLFSIGDQGFVNETEARRSAWRKKIMDEQDPAKMVVFAPPKDKVKATISVFTDIDCGFCRKLHQDIHKLNDMGIAVRYLAYPRAGLKSHSYEKFVSAWCADDPREALTEAKAGKEPKPRTCPNPVASQYELGEEVGVTGTPAIVFEDGTLEMGYRGAEFLAHEVGVLN